MSTVAILTMIFAVGSIYGGLCLMLYLAVKRNVNQEE